MYVYIEFIDSSGLNYIMFAHNSVALRNKNHPENNACMMLGCPLQINKFPNVF